MRESEVIDLVQEEVKDKGAPDTHVPKWIEFGRESLTLQDKESLVKGEWLNDRHISMAQILIKAKFLNLNGLHNTLYQKKPLNEPDDKVCK